MKITPLSLSTFLCIISLCSLGLLGCQSCRQFFYNTPSTEQTFACDYPLGIIGEIEPVFIEDIKQPFSARIDTGATTSSIDADDIIEFERDRKQWVTFTIKLSENEEIKVSKPVIRRIKIKRPGINESRYIVQLSIRLGKEILIEEFSLGNRDKFKHPVLIGRNVLAGRALVDVNRHNTLSTGF